MMLIGLRTPARVEDSRSASSCFLPFLAYVFRTMPAVTSRSSGCEDFSWPFAVSIPEDSFHAAQNLPCRDDVSRNSYILVVTRAPLPEEAVQTFKKNLLRIDSTSVICSEKKHDSIRHATMNNGNNTLSNAARKELRLVNWDTRKVSELPTSLLPKRGRWIAGHLDRQLTSMLSIEVRRVKDSQYTLVFKRVVTRFREWVSDVLASMRKLQKSSPKSTRVQDARFNSWYLSRQEEVYFAQLVGGFAHLCDHLAVLGRTKTRHSIFDLLDLVKTPRVVPRDQLQSIQRELLDVATDMTSFAAALSPNTKDVLVDLYLDDDRSHKALDAALDLVGFCLMSRQLKQEQTRQPDTRSVDALMADMGLLDDGNHTRKRVPPKPARSGQATSENADRNARKTVKNDNARQGPNKVPANGLTLQHYDLQVDDFEQVQKRRRKTLKDILTPYFNLDKLVRPFKDYGKPDLNKPYGRVLVYPGGRGRHISISPFNLSDGFHITDEKTNAHYFYRQGRLQFVTPQSLNNRYKVPSVDVQQNAKDFVRFLREAAKRG